MKKNGKAMGKEEAGNKWRFGRCKRWRAENKWVWVLEKGGQIGLSGGQIGGMRNGLGNWGFGGRKWRTGRCSRKGAGYTGRSGQLNWDFRRAKLCNTVRGRLVKRNGVVLENKGKLGKAPWGADCSCGGAVWDQLPAFVPAAVLSK